MISLTDLGIRQTRVTIFVMLLILIAGAMTFVGFPKREDPAITVRTAVVSALNEGLSLYQLEELVARPLEEAARSISGVDEVRTQLIAGAVVMQIDIETEVPESGIEAVFMDIRNDMEDLTAQMPSGTVGPIVNTGFGDVAIATVAVAGKGFTLRAIERAAEDLRDRLYSLDAVSAVTLYGAQDEVIWLEIDRSRLASTGVALAAVVEALQGQNVRLPSGSFKSGGTRILLETSGDFSRINDIENTLVEIPDVGLLRLGDLVSVRRGYEDPVQQPVFFNGEPAVLTAIEMYPGEDIVGVGAQIKELLAEYNADQPWGLEATFSTYQPEVVDASVSNAITNMLQTFLVVLLVMFFFLGLKQALVIASIVPFAVAFSFALMPALGVELQQVSIAAIIISLGMLVDNGVVIVEDMDRRIRAGAGRREAAEAAGAQYTAPLLIASITTVAAFLPLFLLDGTEGQYGYSLGAVVGLMLTGSFITALYILPTLAVWFLPEPKVESKSGVFDSLAQFYGYLVGWAVRSPWLVIVSVFAIGVASVSQMPNVRQQLFPLSERAQFLVYLDLPKGSDISATQEEVHRLTEWLTNAEINPEVSNVTSFVGFGGPRFVLTLDPADVDPASAFLVVNTENFETSLSVIERAQTELSLNYPNVRARLKRLAMGGREPGIEVKVSGPDADKLLDAAYRIENRFASVPGLIENQGDWGNREMRGEVIIAQDRARQYGITSSEISEGLEGFFDGTRISVFRETDRQIPIVMRGETGARDSFSDLLNVVLGSDKGFVSLKQIASFEPNLEFYSLRRVDQRRTVTVSAISSELTAHDLVDHVQPLLDELKAELGSAYEIEIGGEVEQAGEVREKLGGGLPFALAVMLFALIVQFNSFRRVGITLACVPLVVFGVPLSLLIFDQPMSFFGTLGMIALSGIIINNAIVMIDQIDIEREDLPLSEAIVVACRKRFRPILLTSMTTVMGLFPMAYAGGALWEPMATLMAGGLGLASLLTLFYVPALYRLAFAFKRDAMPRDTQQEPVLA
ncbi:efflux RND transporter permease subunit [Labrenzia sp. CE80]|uniref:efflux RND transporter permease subunit n=1 Tax=Labrenzia sp. CE80 TaxID=1788986 RepID=UPI00138A66EA|nr:efflux RND transporter permease subunit [Labrenzia sp. CE80]